MRRTTRCGAGTNLMIVAATKPPPCCTSVCFSCASVVSLRNRRRDERPSSGGARRMVCWEMQDKKGYCCFETKQVCLLDTRSLWIHQEGELTYAFHQARRRQPFGDDLGG